MSTVKSKKLQVGTDSTSTNNFTIYQPSTPDGTLRIGQGDADSPTEIGQFNANGYKPQTVVAFKVYNGTAQSISHNTTSKAEWSATSWDLNADFDLTNNKFIAPYDGIYQFSAGVGYSGLPDSVRQGTQLRLNGNTAPNNNYWNLSGGANATTNTPSSATIKLDADDYIEVFTFQDSGSAKNTSTNASVTYFVGALIHLL